LAELRSLLKSGEQVRLFAISVDTPAQSAVLAEKLAKDERGPVNYLLLSDPGHTTIDAYGVRDPAYDGEKFDGIPHPAVYVVDRKGRISWAVVEADFRKRPSIEDIRAALDALK
jgi:peroxiredoxin